MAGSLICIPTTGAQIGVEAPAAGGLTTIVPAAKGTSPVRNRTAAAQAAATATTLVILGGVATAKRAAERQMGLTRRRARQVPAPGAPALLRSRRAALANRSRQGSGSGKLGIIAAPLGARRAVRRATAALAGAP